MTSSAADPPLVIVGASVRAMAASAARVGFRVFAADLFGDHDLRAVATDVTTVRPYPDGIPTAVARFPKAPLIYTGALENHPALLATLAAGRPLAGASPEAVMRARDPFQVAKVIRAAGLFFADTRLDPAGLPADGTWLVKPQASAGGHGIRPWMGHNVDGSSHLWQRRLAGQRLSVGYVLAHGTHQLLGVTRQLLGCRWCRASPFAYCGSIELASTSLIPKLARQIVLLGQLLTDSFGLAGLVGVDLIVDAHADMWVIEINPRPTASMELAERSTGRSLAALHVAAFGISSPMVAEREPRPGPWAKAVLFARRDLHVSEATVDAVASRADAWTRLDRCPAVADLPEPPCTIPWAAPVCTVFAQAATRRAALVELRARVAAVENAFLG